MPLSFSLARLSSITSICAALALAAGSSANAQDTFTWDGGGDPDPLWSNPANWDIGVPNGNDILNFSGTVNLLTSNDLAGYGGHRIFFTPGAGNFTLAGNALTLFDFDGNAPKIENNSTGSTQTIGLAVTLNGSNGGAFGEINPVDGNLVMSGGVDLAGTTQLRIFGNNGNTVTFSAPITSSGGANSVAINQNSTVIYSAANTYTGDTFINAGELRFNAGGSASSALQLGDTTGAANATLTLGVTAGGQTLGNAITVRTGSSGTKTIRALTPRSRTRSPARSR